jgi:nucleoside phosphorylase
VGIVESVTAFQRGSETPNGFQLSPAASMKLLTSKSATWTPKEISQSADKMRVVSGETFCASDAYRNKLVAQSMGDVIDMNLFGLVTVAARYNVPVIAWRVVSDNAGDDATKEFSNFTRKYDGAGGAWVAEWIEKLPKNPADPESYDNLNKLIQE